MNPHKPPLDYLAGIFYVRDFGDEAEKVKKFGKIFWRSSDRTCRVLLYGFHQGLCGARPMPDFKDPPFLRGELRCVVGTHGDEPQYLFVGSISTTETTAGHPIYTVSLECCPFLSGVMAPAGIFLDVNLDDAQGYRKDT